VGISKTSSNIFKKYKFGNFKKKSTPSKLEILILYIERVDMGMAMGCHLLAVEHQQMTWSNARQSQGPAMWHSWMLRGDGGVLWNHMRVLSQNGGNTGIPIVNV